MKKNMHFHIALDWLHSLNILIVIYMSWFTCLYLLAGSLILMPLFKRRDTDQNAALNTIIL